MEGFENIESSFVNDAVRDWEPKKLVKAWCGVFESGYLTNKSSTFCSATFVGDSVTSFKVNKTAKPVDEMTSSRTSSDVI